MRCLSCDRRLNDRESVRRYASSGAFIDLCDRCFGYISEDVPDLSVDGGSDASDDLNEENLWNDDISEDDEDAYNHFVNFNEYNGNT